jgi:hypothetical protein
MNSDLFMHITNPLINSSDPYIHNSDPYIHIQRDLFRLSLCQEGYCLHCWPIAIGKATTPTPLGLYRVVSKVILDGKQVYGSRWIGLSLPRYGIHGTNNPNSIGNMVSLGCIRMHNKDVELLFDKIIKGTLVDITPR